MKQGFPAKRSRDRPGSAHFSQFVMLKAAALALHQIFRCLVLNVFCFEGFWIAFNCCASR